MSRPATPIEARFWKHVTGGDVTRCWTWTGALDRNGYGCFSPSALSAKAHRVAWVLLRGDLPDNLTIDHLCRNRPCVNPWHMDPVPIGVNVLRGNNPCAINARKTHCPQGHPYSLENTYVIPSTGGRMCRACAKARPCQSRAQRRAAAERRAAMQAATPEPVAS